MPILTRTTRYTSTTNIATVLGVPASALALLSGETQGFAINATSAGGMVAVIDTGTPANNKNDVALAASNRGDQGNSLPRRSPPYPPAPLQECNPISPIATPSPGGRTRRAAGPTK